MAIFRATGPKALLDLFTLALGALAGIALVVLVLVGLLRVAVAAIFILVSRRHFASLLGWSLNGEPPAVTDVRVQRRGSRRQWIRLSQNVKCPDIRATYYSPSLASLSRSDCCRPVCAGHGDPPCLNQPLPISLDRLLPIRFLSACLCRAFALTLAFQVLQKTSWTKG